MKKILFLLFLIPTLLFAQEQQTKNIPFEFNDFSGGLNSKLSPFSLPKKQAVIAENCRFDAELNSLSKRKQTLLYGTADASEAITGGHRLYLKDGTKILIVTHGDEIETGADSTGAFTNILNLTTGNYRWQWVTWNNIAIGTDGYNQPVKYDGTSASATYLGTCLATAGAAGNPNGTYTYKVSFYTSTYEVLFGVASNSITVSSKKVELSMIPIAPDTYGGEDVIGRKIYRVEGGTWKLLSNGTIANNTAVILTDNDTTASGANYPTANGTTVFSATPPKGRLCIIHYNRLFIANDPNAPSRLYFSDDSSADYFVPTDYYFDIRPDDGDQITFLAQWLGILTIGKDNSIVKVYTDGSTPSSDWSISDPFTKVGCRAMYSAKVTPIGIVYFSNDGLYKFNGQYSQLISDAVSPVIKDISESNFRNCWSEYHKNIYYFSYPSKATGSSINNRILLFDMLSNAYSIDKLNVNCFVTFSSGTDWDTLYYGSSSDGKVYFYTETGYELVHSKHSDFTGTFTSCRYIPTSVGGDANDPIIEIARTGDIDSLSGIINNMTGTIDRDSLTATYVSQGLNLGASTYDKIYWNERFISSGDNITLAVRSASTEAGLTGAWSSEYTDPTGSDISALTANTWTQYRISLTTDAYTHSPELYKANNYVVRLGYKKQGTTTETTIPLHWQSGWTDLGYPGRRKILTKIICVHNSPLQTGTLTLKFSLLDFNQGTKKYEEIFDTFNIDLSNYPNYYTEYFTNGTVGEWVNLDITNGVSTNDLNPLDVKKVILYVDIEPLV